MSELHSSGRFSRPWPATILLWSHSCSQPLFLQRGKMWTPMVLEKTYSADWVTELPITRMSVFCPYRWFWVAPELGVDFLRFLLCPALFFECKKECRPGFCTPPPRYIHSVWSHCSGPKNLGIKVRKRMLVKEAWFLLNAFWNYS